MNPEDIRQQEQRFDALNARATEHDQRIAALARQVEALEDAGGASVAERLAALEKRRLDALMNAALQYIDKAMVARLEAVHRRVDALERQAEERAREQLPLSAEDVLAAHEETQRCPAVEALNAKGKRRPYRANTPIGGINCDPPRPGPMATLGDITARVDFSKGGGGERRGGASSEVHPFAQVALAEQDAALAAKDAEIARLDAVVKDTHRKWNEECARLASAQRTAETRATVAERDAADLAKERDALKAQVENLEFYRDEYCALTRKTLDQRDEARAEAASWRASLKNAQERADTYKRRCEAALSIIQRRDILGAGGWDSLNSAIAILSGKVDVPNVSGRAPERAGGGYQAVIAAAIRVLEEPQPWVNDDRGYRAKRILKGEVVP